MTDPVRPSVTSVLSAEDPDDQRHDDGNDQARCDRSIEEAGLRLDANVSRQVPETEAPEPWPQEAGHQEKRSDGDQDTLHAGYRTAARAFDRHRVQATTRQGGRVATPPSFNAPNINGWCSVNRSGLNAHAPNTASASRWHIPCVFRFRRVGVPPREAP